MLPSRPLLAACILMMAGLAWSVALRPPPRVAVADAALWEGQTVAIEGWATEVRPEGTGMRFALRDGAKVLDAHLPSNAGAARLSNGDRVLLVGRVGRWQGTLRLDADAGTPAEIVAGPSPVQPAWDDLAARPDGWQGTLLRLEGRIEGGRLADDGHSIALGSGAWPKSGDVSATGLLRSDPSCLCERFDAHEVRARTP